MIVYPIPNIELFAHSNYTSILKIGCFLPRRFFSGEVSEELAAAYHLPLDPHLNWFTLETPKRRRPLLCFSPTERDEVGAWNGEADRSWKVGRFKGAKEDPEKDLF